jgi:hypothetical protein
LLRERSRKDSTARETADIREDPVNQAHGPSTHARHPREASPLTGQTDQGTGKAPGLIGNMSARMVT